MPTARSALSVLVTLVAALLTMTADQATAAVDLRGTWRIETFFPNGAQVNTQYHLVSAGDPATGVFTATTTLEPGRAPFGTATITVAGSSVTTVNPYTGGGYTATFVGTLGSDGRTVQGTWSDTNGRDGTYTGRNTSPAPAPPDPPADPPGPPPSPSPDGAGKRPSELRVGCNRGPSPGDPAVCTAAVADAGPSPRTTAPSGDVRWSAPAGLFTSGATCRLTPTPSIPGVARCEVTYLPPAGTRPGTALRLTAAYPGDAVFAASSGDPTSPGGPRVVDPATIVCDARVPGGCAGALPRPTELVVCVPTALGACQGVGAGAVLAGVWGTAQPGVSVDLDCPGIQGASARSHQAAPPCLWELGLEARDAEIYAAYEDLWDRADELAERFEAARRRGPASLRLRDFTLYPEMSAPVRTAMLVYTRARPYLEAALTGRRAELAAAVNRATGDERIRLQDLRALIDSLERSLPPRLAAGTTYEGFMRPYRATTRIVIVQRPRAPGGRTAHARRRPSLQDSSLVVARRTVTVAAGDRRRVLVPYGRTGRALLAARRALGGARLTAEATATLRQAGLSSTVRTRMVARLSARVR